MTLKGILIKKYRYVCVENCEVNFTGLHILLYVQVIAISTGDTTMLICIAGKQLVSYNVAQVTLLFLIYINVLFFLFCFVRPTIFSTLSELLLYRSRAC